MSIENIAHKATEVLTPNAPDPVNSEVIIIEPIAPAMRAPEPVPDINMLNAKWCNTCAYTLADIDEGADPSTLSPAELEALNQAKASLFEADRFSIEVNGEAVTIRKATDDDFEKILDLSGRLTKEGIQTRFWGMPSAERIRANIASLTAAEKPDINLDLIAEVEHTDETTGDITTKIISHGGVSLYVDKQTGVTNADLHLVVDPAYAGKYEPDPIKREARKGKGLGTIMANAIVQTAQPFSVPLTVEVISNNHTMRRIMKNAEILQAEGALTIVYDTGDAYYTVDPEKLPDCTLCEFSKLGRTATSCALRQKNMLTWKNTDSAT